MATRSPLLGPRCGLAGLASLDPTLQNHRCLGSSQSPAGWVELARGRRQHTQSLLALKPVLAKRWSRLVSGRTVGREGEVHHQGLEIGPRAERVEVGVVPHVGEISEAGGDGSRSRYIPVGRSLAFRGRRPRARPLRAPLSNAWKQARS